jgi:hypothetical protein
MVMRLKGGDKKMEPDLGQCERWVAKRYVYWQCFETWDWRKWKLNILSSEVFMENGCNSVLSDN